MLSGQTAGYSDREQCFLSDHTPSKTGFLSLNAISCPLVANVHSGVHILPVTPTFLAMEQFSSSSLGV